MSISATLSKGVALTMQETSKAGRLDQFFEVTRRGSTWLREAGGGLATFLVMSYIVILNPIILTSAPVAEGTYMPSFHAVSSVTALTAGVLTILMGVVARVPLALAAGLGLNAVVAFQLAPIMGYGGAMVVILLEGIITFLLVLTRVREALFHAIPLGLKQAIGAGIGAFLIIVGLVSGGMVSGNAGAPPLEMEPLVTWPRLVFVVVLITIVVLVVRKVRAATIIGIIGGTILAILIESFARLGSSVTNPQGWALNVPVYDGQSALALPDVSIIGQIDFAGALSVGPVLLGFFVFSLLIADLFDTTGTVVSVLGEAKLLDQEGNPMRLRAILGVDSIGAAVGGFAGVSSNTSYIESAAGVKAGARTGFASVVTGLLFLVAAFFTPLASIVPSEAAAPALVVVGCQIVWAFVGTHIKKLQDHKQLALAAVLGILVMPFTYSITNGIGVAFIVYTISMMAAGKSRKIHPLMWVMSVAFIVYFALPFLQQVLGL